MSWYEDKPFIIRDPLKFKIIRERILFPKSGLRLGGNQVSGKKYSILPQATIDLAKGSPNKMIVRDSHTLTAAEGANYRRILHDQSSVSVRANPSMHGAVLVMK